MIEVDNHFFSNESSDEYYTPYLYEFMVDYSEENKSKIDRWFAENKNSWCVGELVDESDDSGIVGDVFFSASPFEISRKTLKFVSEALGKIEKNYKIEDITLLTHDNRNELIGQLFGNALLEYNEVDIFNVGQGNCIYLTKEGNDNGMMFDVGVDKNNAKKIAECIKSYNATSKYTSDSNKVIADNMNIIRDLKPRFFVLSHWDIDHILGVFNYSAQQMDKKWIAPDINERRNITCAAKRLAKYLHFKKSLWMVSADFNGESVYRKGNIDIFKGMSEGNVNNNHGLLIKLDVNNNVVVLPGDCEYLQWANELLETWIDVLVLLHHGAEMEVPNSFEGCFVGVVSAGIDNEYGHPNEEHLHKLECKCACEYVNFKKYLTSEVKILSVILQPDKIILNAKGVEQGTEEICTISEKGDDEYNSWKTICILNSGLSKDTMTASPFECKKGY